MCRCRSDGRDKRRPFTYIFEFIFLYGICCNLAPIPQKVLGLSRQFWGSLNWSIIWVPYCNPKEMCRFNIPHITTTKQNLPNCAHMQWGCSAIFIMYTWLLIIVRNMLTQRRPFDIMMTSSNKNIFRVTGHLCAEFTDPRWIARTKASDVEFWCFLCFLDKRLSTHSWGWWFETLSRS